MYHIKNPFVRLLPLLLLIFIDSFSYFIVIPVLLQLFYHLQYHLLPNTATLAYRNIVTTITISLSPLAALFSSPLIGYISDRHGRKKSLMICISTVILGFTLPIIGILFKHITYILIGRLLAGIGSASQSIAQATVTDLCIGKNRAKYLSYIALMMTIALILGPLAGSELANPNLVYWFNPTTPYFFAVGFSIINLLLLIFCFQETHYPKLRNHPFKLKSVITEALPLIKKNKITLLFSSFFFLELAWSQYYQSIPLFLKLHFHLSVLKIGVFSSAMGLTMSFGLLCLYPILLRVFSISSILRFSLFFTFIGLIACSLSTSILLQWLFSNLVALFTGCAYVSLTTLISNQVNNNHHGLVMGYLSTALYLAWMLTSVNGGLLISWHEKLPLIFSAIFLCLALIPNLLSNKDRHDQKTC